MQNSLTEVGQIIVLIAYFGVASFAWLLPLRKYLGSWEAALRICIPVSLSLQISIAYIFYTGNIVAWYLVFYPIVVLAANIVAVLLLRGKPAPRKKAIHPSYLILIASLLVWVIFIYTRFYDSFTTATPGAIDTLNHLRFLRELQSSGRLVSFPTYAPGFHLLVYPIYLLLGDAATYRFVGPILGLFSGLSLYLLFFKDLKNTASRLLIPALLCFPIFIPLSLQTISFFATSLSFVLFPALLSPLIHDYRRIRKGVYGLLTVLVLALSISVPYLFVQLVPAFIVLSILALCVRSKIRGETFKKILWVTFFLILGFCFSLGGTYLQAKLYSSTQSFPTVGIQGIYTATVPDPHITPTPTPTITTTSTGATVAATPAPLTGLERYPLYTNFIQPFLKSGENVFSIKNIRPLNSLLSIGAYLWGIISLGVLILAFRKRLLPLTLLSYLSLFFTVITQTGMLEMTTYRGRSAWYLLLLTLVTLVFLFDRMKAAEKPAALCLPPLIAVCGMAYPPTFYRPYPPHVFDVANQIVHDHPAQNIVFLADVPELNILGPHISVVSPTPQSISLPCPSNTLCYLLLEKSYFVIDPVLAQQVDATQSNLDTLTTASANAQQAFEINKNLIESSDAFKKYTPVIVDSELTAYQEGL